MKINFVCGRYLSVTDLRF